MAPPTPVQPADRSRYRPILLGLAAFFLVLHFIHLGADLPNASVWRDAARFTDEGWYSDAAIRHTLFGVWRVAGDLNTASAWPVWPLLETLPFAVFGVHLEVARSLAGFCFAGVCAACFLILRDDVPDRRRSLAPEIATILLASSAFGFVFGRLAALETPMLLFTLLAFWMAGRAGRSLPAAIGLGVLLALSLLTKTTAVAVLPSIAWRLWTGFSTGPDHGHSPDHTLYRGKRTLLTLACVILPAAAILGVYLAVVVRQGLRVDIQTVFSVLRDRVNRYNLVRLALDLLFDLRWLGRAVAPLSAWAALAAIGSPRRTKSDPLLQSLWLWIVGYLLFILYRTAFQPRYLLMVLAPVCMLSARELARLLSRQDRSKTAAAALLLVAITLEGLQTIAWTFHQRYTYIDAAAEIRRIVDADPGHPRTLQGSSAAQIALMDGLPHLSGEITSDTTAYLAEHYNAGWYCLWQGEHTTRGESEAFASIQPYFRTVEVRRFQIMDDPGRSTLVLYRLDPIPGAPTPPIYRP